VANKKSNNNFRKIIKLTVAGLVGLFLLWLLWLFKFAGNLPKDITLKAPDNFWGVTYSKRFTSFLNLSWQETYLAILDDLGVKNIRLPIYWQDVEPKEGVYDFSDYDWLLNEGAKRNAKFVLVIGRRLPRWPECHVPEWSKKYPESVNRDKITALLTAIINHYKDRDEIIAWQLENEPLLDSFGDCPKGDLAWLKQELKTVKQLDSRPIWLTASGELSDWQNESKLADVFGTTMYRVVWGRLTGYTRWPIPEWYYQFKLKNVKRLPKNAVIAELQAEPWAPNTSLDKLPEKEANKSFDLKQFKGNLQYAINTGFNQTYLWGVEWWYLEKTQGRGEFWEEAKKLNW